MMFKVIVGGPKTLCDSGLHYFKIIVMINSRDNVLFTSFVEPTILRKPSLESLEFDGKSY